MPVLSYPVDPVVLDNPDKSDEEKILCLDILYEQCKQLIGVSEGRIFASLYCPCGRSLDPLMSFKCYECHIWFCPTCASRHFGFNREWIEKKEEESIIEDTKQRYALEFSDGLRRVNFSSQDDESAIKYVKDFPDYSLNCKLLRDGILVALWEDSRRII